MDIILYNYQGNNNVINKDKTEVVRYSIKMKKNTSLTNPIVPIYSDYDLINFNVNYCYISEFNRYYFVDDVVPYPNKIYRLTLRVDVLESYKDDILNSSSQIRVAGEMDYSSEVSLDSRQQIDIYKGSNEFEEVFDYVLVTLGG